MMRSVRVALAVGLALTATAVGVVLSRRPLTVAGANSTSSSYRIARARGGASGCQQSATVPKGTSAVRISLSANIGPRVTLQVVSGALTLTRGARDAGWGIQETVTVPVKRVPHTVPMGTICLAIGPAVEPVQLNRFRVQTTAANGSVRYTEGFRIEYLRGGHASWWSLASSVAHHMGLGHAASGTWIVFLLIAVMVAVATLTSRLILRELR
jgi:hypothetical protein